MYAGASLAASNMKKPNRKQARASTPQEQPQPLPESPLPIRPQETHNRSEKKNFLSRFRTSSSSATSPSPQREKQEAKSSPSVSCGPQIVFTLVPAALHHWILRAKDQRQQRKRQQRVSVRQERREMYMGDAHLSAVAQERERILLQQQQQQHHYPKRRVTPKRQVTITRKNDAKPIRKRTGQQQVIPHENARDGSSIQDPPNLQRKSTLEEGVPVTPSPPATAPKKQNHHKRIITPPSDWVSERRGGGGAMLTSPVITPTGHHWSDVYKYLSDDDSSSMLLLLPQDPERNAYYYDDHGNGSSNSSITSTGRKSQKNKNNNNDVDKKKKKENRKTVTTKRQMDNHSQLPTVVRTYSAILILQRWCRQVLASWRKHKGTTRGLLFTFGDDDHGKEPYDIMTALMSSTMSYNQLSQVASITQDALSSRIGSCTTNVQQAWNQIMRIITESTTTSQSSSLSTLLAHQKSLRSQQEMFRTTLSDLRRRQDYSVRLWKARAHWEEMQLAARILQCWYRVYHNDDDDPSESIRATVQGLELPLLIINTQRNRKQEELNKKQDTNVEAPNKSERNDMNHVRAAVATVQAWWRMIVTQQNYKRLLLTEAILPPRTKQRMIAKVRGPNLWGSQIRSMLRVHKKEQQQLKEQVIRVWMTKMPVVNESCY